AAQARRECMDGSKYCDPAGGSCALVENDEWTYFAQCECHDGFDGQRCDRRISPGDSGQKYHCDGPLYLKCPQGKTLRMQYASYGTNFASNTCAFAKHTCTDDRSLAVLRQECEGRQFCTIQDLEYAFPNNNNCTGKRSLIYRYECSGDSPPSSCPESNSIRGEDRCFLFDDSEGKISYREAYERCRRKGGYLASPLTARDHQTFVSAGIPQSRLSHAWIGAISNNKAIPSWNDGSNLTFVPPNSHLEFANACLSYSTSVAIPNSFFWVSENCDQLRNSLCSFVPGSTPNLPTVPIPGKDRESAAHCAETTWRGVIFPRTRACDTVIVDCPDPDRIEGTISRTCECGVEPNGDKTTRYVRWEPVPDSNNCTHRWVREMRTAIARGKEAELVSGETAVFLKSTLSTQLYGGDISGSVDLTKSMLGLARGQYSSLDDRVVRQSRAKNFTQNLGDCGDSLLEGRALPVWALLPNGARISQASDLMQALEESAILLADYSYVDKQALDYDHWAMEVEVRRTVVPSFSPAAAAAPPLASDFGAAGFIPSSNGFAANADVMDDSGFVTRVATGQRQPVNVESFASSKVLENQEQKPSDPVSFSTIRKSPIISLPSTSVLSSSAGPLFSPADSPSFFNPQAGAGARATIQSFGGATEGFDASPPQPTNLRLGYFVFASLGAILSNSTTKVNSQVIGATVNDASRSVRLPDDEPVTLTFFHLHTSGVANPRCVFWDTFVSDWSTTGCRLLATNTTTSVCECNHLTSFAILMDITGEIGEMENTALDVVTVVGCAISIVCLLLSFLVFSCFRSLRGLRSTIHANLCLTLLLAELVFVLGVGRTKNEVACSVTALLLHLLFLSAFCWMLLEGVQLYMMLVQVFEPSSTHIILFYLFAYGVPALIVGVAAGVDWTNYGTSNYCWIDTSTPTIWAFAGPVAAVVIINIFFLLIALRVVLSISSRDRSRADRLRGWLKGSATLLCLLGITWVFGFLTAVHGASVVFAWIFTLLNCTQGIFIFVLHVLLNEKARNAVSRWLRNDWCCFSNPESAANYNSKEYVTSRQRFLNMIRSTAADSADGDDATVAEKRKKRMKKEDTTSSTGPSTASTDTKDKGPLTPTSKTSAWLSQIPSQDDEYDLPPPPSPTECEAKFKDHVKEIKDHQEEMEEDEDVPPPLPSSTPPPLTPPLAAKMQHLQAPPPPPIDYDDDACLSPLSRSTRSLDLRETDNRTP
ncbi:hypothetical protein PFISCL1PPCAC_6839, partial [Pristionchus fissidentatus]